MGSARNSADTALSRTVAGTATLKLLEISAFDVFYTPIEKRFESLTRLARRGLGVPVAAVTGIDGKEQWFKSVTGWMVSRLPLHESPCHVTVERDEVIIVPDMAEDRDFRALALVSGRPGFRFYAGHPLRDGQGAVVGSFCVLDIKPRTLSAEDEHVFRDLAVLAQRELQAVEAGTAYAELVQKLGVARREAMLDPLTRVWNRRGAEAFLNALVRRCATEDAELSVCLVDLDGFKRVNDTYGHAAGDQVLRKLTLRLVECVRQGDVVSRLGGDEFLVILPGAGPQEAEVIGERLVKAMAGAPVRTRAHGELSMTISVGCASRPPGEEVSSATLIEAADRALLACKAGGRNQVKIAAN